MKRLAGAASLGLLACLAWAPGVAAAADAGAADTPAAGERLDFGVTEGLNLNRFLRDGEVAAHLLLHAGRSPRIIVAFPAGNSGIGAWFAPLPQPAHWRLDSAPVATRERDAHERPLRGIRFEASIDAARLEVEQTLLSSVRVLRDWQSLHQAPREVLTGARATGIRLTWSRDRVDGAPGYRLEVEVLHGTLSGNAVAAAADGRIGLRVTALTGEQPLTGLTGPRLLADDGGPAAAATRTDAAARDTLAYLAYEEKLLAGSWRFDTYFGRDTLIAARLLMPVLAPQAIEAGLGSVLARLSPEGAVAHEEDVGEFAVLDHLRHEGKPSAEPVFDYKMIDGDFLLAPVLAAWLLDDPRAGPRRQILLGAHGSALLRNLRRVVHAAEPFAASPDARHLVSLKPGSSVGDWRDSEQGLGGGRYPYDVDAVLVPAALEAIARLQHSGVLTPYLEPGDAKLFGAAARLARTWRERVPPLFAVRVDPARARSAVAAYAQRLELPEQAALGAVAAGAEFHALALDAAGAPIPVMHSDEGFDLLLGNPDPATLEHDADLLLRPFPAGLMTAAGMVVADPVYAGPQLQATFTRNAYHGTVVWSWQQALFAAGLNRQLARHDLPEHTRVRLTDAASVLWNAIGTTRALRNSELWTWSWDGRAIRPMPFGVAAADADESNAAQLWSTVYLGVRAPEGIAELPAQEPEAP